VTARVPAAAVLALASALAACPPARRPGDPTPLAVNPPRGAPATAVQIEISGRDLDARVSTDFTSSDAAANGVDVGYVARLEPASGAAVPLGDVRLTVRHTLVATVPAGLPPGSYRIVIVDPSGRCGVLERAYRVLASADAVARFDVAVVGTMPRAGVAFPISLVARDAGGAVVDGFTGAVTVTDAAGALAPASAGPFVLGRWGGTVTVPDVVAADALTVVDGAAHSGTSAPFDVVAGPPAALAIAGAPLTVRAGTCSPRVDLVLRDALGHPTVAEVDVAVQLQSAPPGLPLFADSGCATAVTALTLPAGTGTRGFHLRAAVAGAVTVRALPASLPSVSQVETVTP
jgi:hypothetical protein